MVGFLSVLICLFFHHNGIIFKILFTYSVLGFALLPSGAIRQFNSIGDYSYGLYVYAFPVQQSLMNYFPGLHPYGLFFAALAIVAPLAILSWHLIEKPCLKLRAGQ